ncbi:MAG TPA: PSD1 and planctomycete cytochrome C domain-containing protein [Chthoniobacteraceae bacterium]|jgi:hypothetical protein|nr:PSD1 and planctomycete cytochrome C domain-containing protein [Chthoniobacteraceae bacterium]
MRLRFPHFASLSLLLAGASLRAAPTPEQIEFFESRIRPILAQDCYECHSTAGKQKAGLVLDSRAGWQKGGDSGDAIVPGKPGESLLMRTIRHLEPDLKMPKRGPKLEERVVQDFEKWIAMGAPDPRDAPPSAAEVAKDRDWQAVLERRKGWWSFQPVQHPAPPAATNWSAQPVDRFLEKAMSARGLAPAADAEPRTILRRLSYVLTGLAPTPEETEQFVRDAAANLDSAIADAADRLLASPRFGEQWARHWMDWMRYAETHGSEGDPQIPFAWRYRDYLIRALNADVPYPQLVREQIAGDLLEHPRTNAALGINESALGSAQYRFVLHGFSPTDCLDEQVTFTDNQIDTISKAFLGLTVSCARCHNHKFDAISQADFYALYGVMASCRPALIDVNLPEKTKRITDEMAGLQREIESELIASWRAQPGEIAKRLNAWQPADEKQKTALLAGGSGALLPWIKLRGLPPGKLPAEWQRLAAEFQERMGRADFRDQPVLAQWSSAAMENDFLKVGRGVEANDRGHCMIDREGDRIVSRVAPSVGVYSSLLSDKERGVLSSPRFRSEGGTLWLRLRGDGKARARYVVDNYPRTGTVFPKVELVGAAEQWVSWNIDYWKGDQIYIELTTESDQPVETGFQERSWFGISEIYYTADVKATAPMLPGGAELIFSHALSQGSPTEEQLVQMYVDEVRGALARLQVGRLTGDSADLLEQLARADILPNKLADHPEIAPLVARYRKLESELPTPTRVPGVLEGFAFDQPLFTRGDHKKPADPVPRRFLEALDPTPFTAGAKLSGRRELAERLVAPTNPLASRVIVNRLWQYVYGRGLVGTPDNFGRLGELPTNPELLDYLATEFEANGGSLKQMIRTLVTARTFRVSSRGSAEALVSDPENRLLSHFQARRLEAEGIRDSMIALSGRLELPAAGVETPPGKDDYRRSVYTRVIRNRLDPLLTAFDFPNPSATRGRRDATNVPAQALALLNAPQVITWAAQWADRPRLGLPGDDVEARIRAMFAEAFGRAPSAQELSESRDFLGTTNPNWHALAEALFNAKEFIYLY